MPKTEFQTPPTIVQPRRDRETPDIPDTPEARQHAREAAAIEAELRAFGIQPERVAPTRDCQGHVRLNFNQVRQLLGL